MVEPDLDLKLKSTAEDNAPLDLDLKLKPDAKDEAAAPDSNKKPEAKPQVKTEAKKKEKKAIEKKFKAVIVDTTDVMKDQARDAGDAAMTIPVPGDPDQLKGVKKILKGEFWSRAKDKIWKHGLMRDYYRNKEVAAARKKILEAQNIFAGEGRDQAAHEKFVADVIEQFSSEYDDAIHKDIGGVGKGEKRRTLADDDKEDIKFKADVKAIIIEYATGRMSEAAFIEAENRIFKDLKADTEQRKVRKNEDVMHASNLFAIAQQVKMAMDNKEFQEGEDFDIDIIYGNSKAGVRTEAKFTGAERLAERISKMPVLSCVNEATAAAAFSIASTVGIKLTQTGARTIGKFLPFVGSALVGSSVAYVKEGKKLEEERRQHAREMARGEDFDAGTMKRREEMEQFRHDTKEAQTVIDALIQTREAMLQHADILTPDVLTRLSSNISEIEARVRLSDRRRIDLFTYSDSTKVVEERKNLDVERAKMKVELKKLFDAGKFSDPQGRNFTDYFNSLTTTQENNLINATDTGIDARDRIFNKMKSKEQTKAAKKAFATGLIIGAAMQEAAALLSDQSGVLEDAFGHNVNAIHGGSAVTGTEHLTGLARLKHLVWDNTFGRGHAGAPGAGGPLHEAFAGAHIKIPGGASMVLNPADGSYSLVHGGKTIADHLEIKNGALTPGSETILRNSGVNIDKNLLSGTSSKHFTSEEYVRTHPGTTHEVHRSWYDNDTPAPKFDKNELRTLWGEGGKGIDSNGNYVLDISHMTPDGSYHAGLSADAQTLIKSGTQVKMLLSLSQATQHQAFEVPINTSGQIVVDPNSEIGKIFFANNGGQAKFLGRFAEIGQDMGDNKFRMLSTLEGAGVTDIVGNVPEATPETILRMPENFTHTYDMPPFIPLIPREPLETLNKKEESKPGKENLPKSLLGQKERKLLAGKERELLAEQADIKRLVAAVEEELEEEEPDENEKNLPGITITATKISEEGRSRDSLEPRAKRKEIGGNLEEERKKLLAKKERLQKELNEVYSRLEVKDGEIIPDEAPRALAGTGIGELGEGSMGRQLRDGEDEIIDTEVVELEQLTKKELLEYKRELERLLAATKAELLLMSAQGGELAEGERRKELVQTLRLLRGLLRDVNEELMEIKDGELVEEESPRIKGLLMEHNPGGETEHVNVDRLIEGNISGDERLALEAAFPGQNIVKLLEGEVIDELNDKGPDEGGTSLEKKNPEESRITKIVQSLRKRLKGMVLALVVTSNFGVGTSFRAMPSAESLAYDNIRVESLVDLENIAIDQEAINNLDNVTIINKGNEGLGRTYLIVDKSTGYAHLYKGGDLVSTYEVGIGQQKGDDQTVTVVRNGKEYWEEGNRQTGAGIYTISRKWEYEGAPSFTMRNERGIEVPTAFHKAPESRAQFFHNNNPKDNRMSNGCLNFMARSLEDLAKQEGFGPGSKVYILPDDPHNKFELADGEIRFVSNQQNVNRTVRPYEAKPIILRAENANEEGKTFLQTLSDETNKRKMMSMYPNVSNRVYNELARITYGIFGQESSFGTYGSLRGQSGRLADYAGTALGGNISAGVTQIRITSVNPKIRDGFGIHGTTDLYDVRKSALATLGLLLDIYTDNIPAERKGDYRELIPLAYNNPTKFRKIIKTGDKVKSPYVRNVLRNADKVKTYSLAFS